MIVPDASDTTGQPTLPPPFSTYRLDAAFDEMLDADGRPRPHYQELYHRLLEMPAERTPGVAATLSRTSVTKRERSAQVECAFSRMGITTDIACCGS